MQQRFRETMDFFFQAVIQQAMDRDAGIVPDLESYITLRRDTRCASPQRRHRFHQVIALILQWLQALLGTH